MKKRHKMSKSYSKKSFKKGSGIHSRNVHSTPMRGGIRL